MDTYFTAHPLEKNDVVQLFCQHSLSELQGSLLWAKAMFDREFSVHDYLGGLVEDLYKLGYMLFLGDIIVKSFGATDEVKQVCLWSRLDDHDVSYSSDEKRLRLHDGIVPIDNPTLLIMQGIALRRAYKDGYGDRNREVQDTLGGLLGIDLQDFREND